MQQSNRDFRILVVDDDPAMREVLEMRLREWGYDVAVARDGKEGRQKAEALDPDIVISDVIMPQVSGMELLRVLKAGDSSRPVILITAEASIPQAVEAMTQGAKNYIEKPIDYAKLRSLLEDTEQEIDLRRESRRLALQIETGAGFGEFVGTSRPMRKVYELIASISASDASVIVTGESGTGKELVARTIHELSPRSGGPFIALNAAAIPENLMESEIFGHEKGAFTGADIRRIGKFEQCDGGTLFLDEIGDLPLATQAKLLRVLQDGSFQRLGSAETVRSDVRILAATNQPLETLITERRFRQDLYYRLKVTSIDLPPLRDREVDVVLLAHHFVRRFNPQFGTHIRRFAPEVLPALLSYPWPGNVRELENVIKASLVVSRGNVFLLDFLPESVRTAAPAAPPPVVEEDQARSETLRRSCRRLLAHKSLHGKIHRRIIELAEREVIQACLEETSGQLAPAARLLGITRTTLRKKMAALGIHVRTSISHD